MDKTRFLKTLDDLTEDMWTYGALYYEGTYCALGWALHKTGVPNYELVDDDGFAFRLANLKFNMSAAETEDIVNLNDMSINVEEAREFIARYLNGEPYMELIEELEERKG
jgi:hypothetical protein